MLEIENDTIVSGEIDGSGHLILVTREGTEIDAGYALVAVPDATISTKGVSELATSAETSALADATRVITPAGLSALIAALEVRLGTLETEMVKPMAVPLESATFSAYPEGISRMALYTGNPSPAWSLANGTIFTYNHDSVNRMYQTWYSSSGGAQTPTHKFRTCHPTNGGGGWTAWT